MFAIHMAKKHTETIDSKLKSAWQIISRMYNAEAAHYGGSIAIGHFLLNIDSDEGAYASDIAPKLGMESDQSQCFRHNALLPRYTCGR